MAISAEALGQRLDVRSAGDLAIDAIAALSERQPEWVPRNGSPEVIYLEAVALVVAGIVSGAEVILGGVVESVLANLYGVPRLAGASATGDLTVTFDASTSTTIPAGTAFSLSEWGIDLVSTADVVVSSSLTATIPVATADATADANGLGATELVDVLDDIPNALSVVISGTLAGGSAPEGDTEYLERARNRLARVTNSLVVADHFTAWALEDGRPSNALGVGAWDGVATGTIGADYGDVAVVTYGRGAQLSTEVKAELAAAMQAITAAGVTVSVVDATLTTVAVTCTVHPLAGWSSDDVRSAVEAAISAYLAPETWVFGETVRTTTLTTVIAAADGVDYVTTLAAPAADVTLAADELAVAGTLTVTVS